jgi:hypothetical protein
VAVADQPFDCRFMFDTARDTDSIIENIDHREADNSFFIMAGGAHNSVIASGTRQESANARNGIKIRAAR